MSADSVRNSRILAAALLFLLGAAVLRDRVSPLSQALRDGRPLTALVSLRFTGQGGVVPPALYLAVYGPAARTLELSLLPPSIRTEENGGKTLADAYESSFAEGGNIPKAGHAMTETAQKLLGSDPLWPDSVRWGAKQADFRVSAELSGDSEPASPHWLRRKVFTWTQRPLFLIETMRLLHTLRDEGGARLTLYDAFLTARELCRLEPGSIRLSRFPGPKHLRPFLGGLLHRASGRPEEPSAPTVEVLNATDVGGVALRATKILRLAGFDVVHFGNAPEHERRQEPLSRFLDRTGRIAAAQAVAGALGCPHEGVLGDMEGRAEADVTVLIGRDHTGCTQLEKE